MRTNVQTQSGNRVVIELDGVAFGLLQNVDWGDNYGHESASGIGDIHSKEWVPSKADHTVSVGMMVMINHKARRVGILAENGDDVLKGRVFDIVAYSKDTGQKLRAARSCTFDSGRVSVNAHRIVVTNAEFKALDVDGLGL